MSINLLIQTCARNFFFLFVQRALEGNITVRQMIELGVLPCFIFSHCLRQRFAVFHRGARTQQRMNRICTKTQSDALCIRRSLVLGRLRGECRPIKGIKCVAKCSVGITKLPNPLRTRYTVYDQSQNESGNQTIENYCSLPKLLQGEWWFYENLDSCHRFVFLHAIQNFLPLGTRRPETWNVVTLLRLPVSHRYSRVTVAKWRTESLNNTNNLWKISLSVVFNRSKCFG